MQHVNPNAIGSLVPLFAGGSGSGGAVPPTQDHQSPSLIVGNAAAGDTIFVCDILDPGDGTGIQLAVNQAAADAGGRRFVFVRAGLYTIAAPIVVPRGVRVQGSGIFETIFETTATSRTALIVNNGAGDIPCEISDFLVNVPVAAPGATGTMVLDLSQAVAHDILIIFNDDVQSGVADDSLTDGFWWDPALRGDNAVLWAQRLVCGGGISYAAAGLPGSFSSFTSSGGAPGAPQRFSACQSIGNYDDVGAPLAVPDTGFTFSGPVSCIDCNAFVPQRFGFQLTDTDASTFVGCSVVFGSVNHAFLPYGGFFLGGDSSFVSFTACKVIAFDPAILPFFGHGFALIVGIGEANSLLQCDVVGMGRGVELSAGNSNARVGFCYLSVTGGPTDNLLDAGYRSELAHNIPINFVPA